MSSFRHVTLIVFCVQLRGIDMVALCMLSRIVALCLVYLFEMRRMKYYLCTCIFYPLSVAGMVLSVHRSSIPLCLNFICSPTKSVATVLILPYSILQLELRSYDDESNSKTSTCVSLHRGGDSSSENDSSEEKKECNHNHQGRTSVSKQNNALGGVGVVGGGGDNDEAAESEMRGVHAKTNIPADTICVAIPRKCLITVEMGQATEIGQIILRSDLDLDAPKHIFLMVFLLWDRKINGDKSFFKPYYDILPKTLRNIPIFWSESELEYLKGSYLLTQISDRIDAITEDYYAICHVAPQLAMIASLEEFKWARMCVCSRNFGLQIDGHRTSALVPHADMLNHHRPRETKWSFDDDLQAFTITT